MIAWIKKHYYSLKIVYLSLFKPTVLFERINQLGWYKSTLRQWFDDQQIAANKKVLEVGCATGELTDYIARTGAAPTGADYSQDMIKIAKRKYGGDNFFVADVHNLPFESEKFDAVIATSLINIVNDKNKAMHELSRCCKKDGIVSVLVPADTFDDNHLDVLLSSIGDTGFSSAAMTVWHKKPPKMNTDEIIKLFQQAGLRKTSIKYYLNAMLVSVTGIKIL